MLPPRAQARALDAVLGEELVAVVAPASYLRDFLQISLFPQRGLALAQHSAIALAMMQLVFGGGAGGGERAGSGRESGSECGMRSAGAVHAAFGAVSSSLAHAAALAGSVGCTSQIIAALQQLAGAPEQQHRFDGADSGEGSSGRFLLLPELKLLVESAVSRVVVRYLWAQVAAQLGDPEHEHEREQEQEESSELLRTQSEISRLRAELGDASKLVPRSPVSKQTASKPTDGDRDRDWDAVLDSIALAKVRPRWLACSSRLLACSSRWHACSSRR